jgi:NADP-dependent 3-hydroxy acid dehydrogenase YdfG
MEEAKNWKNKVILVTGAAGGLGKAISTLLLETGSTVILTDIHEEKAIETAAKLKGNAMALEMDVADENRVKEVMRHIRHEYGRLDVLINNAGIDVTKSIMHMEVSEWDCITNVNLRGPFLTAKYALPIMAEQQSGHIVNVISTASLRAWTEASAYHATKWGLRGFTQALFTEARRDNIKVTAVIAGGMKTDFLFSRFPDIDRSKLQDPLNVARTIKFVLEQPEESVVPEVMVLPLQETSWP